MAFYYIWNSFSLVGSVGKSLTTFYLNDAPDYAVFHWLSTQTLTWLGSLEIAEQVTARVRNCWGSEG